MGLIEEIMSRDTFCVKTVGVELLEVTPGRAKTRLKIEARHLNGLGIIQGGVIFTLADFALAAACNSHGTAAVLINSNISYFKGLTGGTLLAEATEETINHKLGTYTIRVISDTGELVALMQATVYRKKETLESLL